MEGETTPTYRLQHMEKDDPIGDDPINCNRIEDKDVDPTTALKMKTMIVSTTPH
uniref:Uncharacterized protein n=1 Tax=Cucumis melo TaxID=3656 RepID=A0A9I9CKT3_CUCME